MFSHKQADRNENKKFIIAVIALIALSVIFYATLAVKRARVVKAPMIEKPAVSETEAAKANNRQVIEEAERFAPRPVRPIDATDHVRGKIGAPVGLIVYSDFECEYCANFSLTVAKIFEEYGDKVAVAYRHYPLRTNPNSLAAAIASECASAQGKFWEMHDQLFADNLSDRLSPEQFKRDAAGLGLDQVKFNKCLDTEQYKDKIWLEFAAGKDCGVAGTPGSFVNGEPVPGDVPYDDFTDSAGLEREGMKSIVEKHLNDD